jgi:hypothetical protein
MVSELVGTGDSSALDLTRVDRVVQESSRQVEYWTDRVFYPQFETRYYMTADLNRILVDDLLAITSLVTDRDNDGTYAVSWTEGTHYYLDPRNVNTQRGPYRAIERIQRLTTQQWFPRGVYNGVKIVGKWGYYEVPQTISATVAGAHAADATTLEMSAVAELSVGHILKIGTEYLRVDTVQLSSVVVVRGINGSTAAAIDDGAAVQILTFPGITDATLRTAVRTWHLRTAPLGIATAGVQSLGSSAGGTRWIQQDMDLRDKLEPFIRVGGVAI